jgi:hypothetical protein
MTELMNFLFVTEQEVEASVKTRVLHSGMRTVFSKTSENSRTLHNCNLQRITSKSDGPYSVTCVLQVEPGSECILGTERKRQTALCLISYEKKKKSNRSSRETHFLTIGSK